MPASRPGDLVTPTVRLVREIARGPSGVLWLGEDVSLGRSVLVRTLPEATAHDVDAIERFMFQAQSEARIDSPHVLRVLKTGMTSDVVPYAILEHAQGEVLAERLRRAGPLSIDDAAKVVHQVALALEAAHAAEVVHHAVSTESVLLQEGRDVFVRVLDFDPTGQAVAAGRNLTGATLRAAARMSPEQLLSPADVDARADVWSLAVLAYECLTARLPFEGATLAAVFMAIDRSQYKPATAFRPDLPPSIDAFFERAFRHAIDERFRAPAELDAAFESAVRGAIGAFPESENEPIPLVASDIGTSDRIGETERPIWRDTTYDEHEVDELEALYGRRRRSGARFGIALLLSLAVFVGAGVVYTRYDAIRSFALARFPELAPRPVPAAGPAPTTPEPTAAPNDVPPPPAPSAAAATPAPSASAASIASAAPASSSAPPIASATTPPASEPTATSEKPKTERRATNATTHRRWRAPRSTAAPAATNPEDRRIVTDPDEDFWSSPTPSVRKPEATTPEDETPKKKDEEPIHQPDFGNPGF